MNLHPYQHMIGDFIITHKRCNVFVPMGLGKTVSTLSAIDTLSFVEDVVPVLVVAPLRVARSTWPGEIAKWDSLRHLRVTVVTGTPTEREAALANAADIYCTNFENIPWLVQHLDGEWPFKMVIVDECSKLKGFRLGQGTKRAKALAKFVHKSPRYVGLSGTPSSNGLQDLWGPLWFVDRGERLEKSFEKFCQRWFRKEQVGNNRFATKLIPMPHTQQGIQSRISDVCMSLDAKDWFDLKDPIMNVIEVELPPAADAIYRKMEDEMFLELASGETIEAVHAASKTIKCLQISSGAVITDDKGFEVIHDEKLDALESVIEEAQGASILVAYHFRSDLARLKARFPQGRELSNDPQVIADWNEGKLPLLFCHPQSAGHGLSLQHGGNILVFFSHWWNLEEYQQMVERIGPTRQKQSGYDRPVFIHHIVAKGTLDAVVMQRRESKREVQDLLMEALQTRI